MRRTLIGLLAAVMAVTVVGCEDRPALQFAPDTLADASVGAPYEQRIDVSENVTPVGGFSIQDGALPAGLSIEKLTGDDAAGRIVGTPQAAGRYTFTVAVWCFATNVSGQQGTEQYTLVVR